MNRLTVATNRRGANNISAPLQSVAKSLRSFYAPNGQNCGKILVSAKMNCTGLFIVRACASKSRIAGRKPVFILADAQALAIRDFAFMSKNTYELSVVHPAVADWLTSHDYTYQHEVYMPDFGRADFVATHDDGHILIVEAKEDCTSTSRAITQVSDYRQQYNKQARIAIAVPNHTITDRAIGLCARRKCQLIGVLVDTKEIFTAPRNPSIDIEMICQIETFRTEWNKHPNRGIYDAIYLYVNMDLSFESIVSTLNNYLSDPILPMVKFSTRLLYHPIEILNYVYGVCFEHGESHEQIVARFQYVLDLMELALDHNTSVQRDDRVLD